MQCTKQYKTTKNLEKHMNDKHNNSIESILSPQSTNVQQETVPIKMVTKQYNALKKDIRLLRELISLVFIKLNENNFTDTDFDDEDDEDDEDINIEHVDEPTNV
jgi:hypothetical protein